MNQFIRGYVPFSPRGIWLDNCLFLFSILSRLRERSHFFEDEFRPINANLFYRAWASWALNRTRVPTDRRMSNLRSERSTSELAGPGSLLSFFILFLFHPGHFLYFKVYCVTSPPPYSGSKLPVLGLPFQMAAIAWQISIFWPSPKKKKFRTYFLAQMDTKILFGPIECKAVEILDRLLSTEWQGHRITESLHIHSLYSWVKFFCAFQINSITCFAPKGIILSSWEGYYMLCRV